MGNEGMLALECDTGPCTRAMGLVVSGQEACQAGCWMPGNPVECLPKWTGRACGTILVRDAICSLESIQILHLGATAPTVLCCGSFSLKKWTETAKGSHRAGKG